MREHISAEIDWRPVILELQVSVQLRVGLRFHVHSESRASRVTTVKKSARQRCLWTRQPVSSSHATCGCAIGQVLVVCILLTYQQLLGEGTIGKINSKGSYGVLCSSSALFLHITYCLQILNLSYISERLRDQYTTGALSPSSPYRKSAHHTNNPIIPTQVSRFYASSCGPSCHLVVASRSSSASVASECSKI